MTIDQTDPRYARWPTRDRIAWERAVTDDTDAFFEDRPRLAAWAPSTQRNARNVVSAFLRWLEARAQVPMDGSLADITTPELLLAYVRERCSLHAPPTVKYEVWLMEGVLEVFAPDQDWRWIKKISRKLGARARRHVPSPRPIVHAAVLYDLGIQVMRESWNANGGVNLSLYRAGFAVALLAAAPMRIANFSTLEIGRQLRREESRWVIYLTADETKTRRADVWPISGQLSLCLDQYLAVVRPALLQRARHSAATGHLWIGDSGHPIGHQVLRPIIATLTRERLGIQINPHTFRHCAATTFALERPRDALQSSALLGHASPQTTERHYIVQQRQLVQQDYIRLLHKRSRSSPNSEKSLAFEDNEVDEERATGAT
jgi:integrase/recombinase XerD